MLMAVQKISCRLLPAKLGAPTEVEACHWWRRSDQHTQGGKRCMYHTDMQWPGRQEGQRWREANTRRVRDNAIPSQNWFCPPFVCADTQKLRRAAGLWFYRPFFVYTQTDCVRLLEMPLEHYYSYSCSRSNCKIKIKYYT
jgi:hypothetical protein